MTNTWLILDTNYLCHRARYSMGDLSYQGSPTGVIYGVINTVLLLQKQFNTNKLLFCFDSKYSKRQKIYPQYKANRTNRKPMSDEEKEFEKQFHQQIVKLRRDYLPTIGYRNIFQQKGYESDDIIARLVRQLRDDDIIIITADQDMFQCIRSNVRIFNPHKKQMMTRHTFIRMYGIDPSLWGKVKSIAGCSTDNVKGIPGIGEKTAIAYLQGRMNTATKTYQKIRQWKLDVRMSSKRSLIASMVMLPFPGTKRCVLKKDRISITGWNTVCRQLGFKSLVDKRGRRER